MVEFAGVLTMTAIRYLGLNPAYGMPFQSIREHDIQAMLEEILRAGSIKDGSNFFVVNTISRFTCAICLRLFPSGVRSFHLA